MKRIIIHGLKPEYRSFGATIQGWPTQPSLTEFENLLSSQESLAKQFSGVQLKSEETAMYVNKAKSSSRHNTSQSSNRNHERAKQSEGENMNRTYKKGEGSGEKKPRNHGKRFPYKCHKCGRRGHMAKHCRSPKEEGNVAAAENHEAGWETEALMAQIMNNDLTQGVEAQYGKMSPTHVQPRFALATSTGSQINTLDDWIVDSGCTNHMTGDKSRLLNPVPYDGNQVVVIADNSRHKIAHVGDAMFPTSTNQKEVKLDNVFHVPSMGKNLFSVPQITATGKYVLFGPNQVCVFDDFKTPSIPILSGHRRDSVYVLSAEAGYIEKTNNTHSVDLWYSRLGHVSYSKLDLMMNKQLVAGLPLLKVQQEAVCPGCQFGKAHQQKFHQSNYRSKEPLELVHSDVFGPVRCSSIGGMRFMITFIDELSRFLWVAFMKEKSEALVKFKAFQIEAEKLTGRKIKVLRNDNGGEYLS